jgi:hypothetical protein
MFLVINGKGLSKAQVANLRQHQVDMFLVIWNSTSCKLVPALGIKYGTSCKLAPESGLFLVINGMAQVANLRQHKITNV